MPISLSSDDLVSESTISVAKPAASSESLPSDPSDPVLTEESDKGLAEEIAAEEVQSGELLEEAPTSSRRPIADADREPEDDRAPRHTPPPESGKQVAAPLASESEPSAVRRSSAPPADVIRPQMPAGARVASFSGIPTVTRPATFGELIEEAFNLGS
jgi:hypothetical protein